MMQHAATGGIFACGDTKDIEQPVSLSYRDSDGHAREPTEAAVVRELNSHLQLALIEQPDKRRTKCTALQGN